MDKGSLDYWNELVGDSPDALAIVSPDGVSASREYLQKQSDQLCHRWVSEGLKPRGLLALNLPNGIEWFAAYLACLKLGVVAAPLDPGCGGSEMMNVAIDLRVEGVWDGSCLRSEVCEKPYFFRRKDISVVKLTSGSTGRAKKLFFADSELMEDARNLISCMGIRSEDTNLGVIPWAHSYGLGSIVYPLLLQGTCVAWTNTVFPSEIAKVCKKAQCTLFPSVPTVLRALANSDCEKSDFESVRLVISAGARLDPDLARSFRSRFGKIVHNFYGSTETGGICFDQSGKASLSGSSVGEPIQGVSIIERRGKRFYVASKAVYSYGNRNRSPEGIPMALMGDFGSLNSDGQLVLDGRAKNVLNIGGRRINPLGIENRLKLIDGVSDVAVFSVRRNGEEVLACAFETVLSRDQIRPQIRGVLSARDRPKKWIVYDRFPVTPRGKTDLAVIRREVV